MSSNHRTVYVLRGGAAAGTDDGWVSPEPVEHAVREEILAATDLGADDVDPLGSHVDLAAVEAVVADGGSDEVAFDVADHDVVVTSDGDVRVDE